MEKRLGLKDDEIAAVYRELTSLMSEHSKLQSENKQLKTSLDAATQEINRLKEIINSGTKLKSHEELSEVAVNILKTIFQINSHVTISQFANHLEIKESFIQYHIDRLKELNLIGFGELRMNSPLTYALTKQGRKHVVENIGI